MLPLPYADLHLYRQSPIHSEALWPEPAVSPHQGLLFDKAMLRHSYGLKGNLLVLGIKVIQTDSLGDIE